MNARSTDEVRVNFAAVTQSRAAGTSAMGIAFRCSIPSAIDLRLSSLRTGIPVRRRERQLVGELRGVRGRPELTAT